jgi:thymidylate synthase (FAD)
MSAAQELFSRFGGHVVDGFPAINAMTFHTDNDIPYLKEPGVGIISKPHVDIRGLEGFLAGFEPKLGFTGYLLDPDPLPDSAQLCKTAGQVCYASFGPKHTPNADAGRYFNNIITSGHGSVLEHASFSFLLYGISRSLTHELVRHRAGTAFSQVSQRYVSGKVLRFVERPEYVYDYDLHRQFEARIDRAARDYEDIVEKAMLKEDSTKFDTDARKRVQQTARSVLPNETEAPMVFTANVRSLRHIIEMRASEHAETEIRKLAVRMFLCLVQVEPLLFGDYILKRLEDRSYAVSTPYGKV